ncbi:hypothetical protein COO60DRAFT_1506384, partial [Scenedesmus sp. NREL 46B-D3]
MVIVCYQALLLAVDGCPGAGMRQGLHSEPACTMGDGPFLHFVCNGRLPRTTEDCRRLHVWMYISQTRVVGIWHVLIASGVCFHKQLTKPHNV